MNQIISGLENINILEARIGKTPVKLDFLRTVFPIIRLIDLYSNSSLRSIRLAWLKKGWTPLNLFLTLQYMDLNLTSTSKNKKILLHERKKAYQPPPPVGGGGGTPTGGVPLPGGYPCWGGYPSRGTPLTSQMGYPPGQLDGVPPLPSQLDGGTPPDQPDGVPPPQVWTDTQTENITSSRTTYAVGNKTHRYPLHDSSHKTYYYVTTAICIFISTNDTVTEGE